MEMEKGLSFVQLAGVLAFVLFSETACNNGLVTVFLHCQAGSVTAWHARRFHLLISSFLCKTEGVKSPVCHGMGFLGGEGGAALGVSDLFRIICIALLPNVFIFFMNEDTRMQ